MPFTSSSNEWSEEIRQAKPINTAGLASTIRTTNTLKRFYKVRPSRDRGGRS